MTPARAEQLARDLMGYYLGPGWRFAWSRQQRVFGTCDGPGRTITLSKALTLANGETPVLDTILHEIAHALTARPEQPSPGVVSYQAAQWALVNGHTETWRQTCLAIGGTGERCFRWGPVAKPPALRPRRYRGTCAACGRSGVYNRRVFHLACSRCARPLDWERLGNRDPLRARDEGCGEGAILKQGRRL